MYRRAAKIILVFFLFSILIIERSTAYSCRSKPDGVRASANIENALKDLADTVKTNLGGRCESYILSSDNREIVID